MAAITVKQEGTGIITFDTDAEVGAAGFISYIKKVWGEGVLLKPSSTGTSAFTARTRAPFPHGIYTFLPKSGTAVNTTLHNSCLAAYSTGSRTNSVILCCESGCTSSLKLA